MRLGALFVILAVALGVLGEPYALVSPDLYLARRLHHHELPEGVEIIVDLTAEFAAPDGVPVGRTYHALPALDTHVPEETRWNALVDEIAKSKRVALVHCAAGHGRSPHSSRPS